jgi:hypothetical protein
MNIQNIIKRSFNVLLSTNVKHRVEKITLIVAIVSYLIHLLLILLNAQGFIELEQKFFKNPIAAIYTPFSFILLYEVYLLIYFLPKSSTVYAYVELTSDWFQDKNDLQFTFDVLTSLILFFLIFLFYQSIRKTDYTSIEKLNKEGFNIRKFVLLKKLLAVILVPILVILAFYTLINWGAITFNNYANGILEFKKINNIFFDEFFSVLIIVDVLLLLFSFFYSDKFHKIIRNSGFVISTILIKVSFLADGIVNNLLIISAVLFGYILLIIHNLYEKNAVSNQIKDSKPNLP